MHIEYIPISTLDGLAYEIAARAHSDQFRADGKAYITHPIAVSKLVSENNDVLKAIALLHDVLEDTSFTAHGIEVNFSKHIFECVQLLTKLKDENYCDFIMRIYNSKNIDAIKVKIADLNHNIQDNGKPEGSLKDKYRLAKLILSNRLDEVL